MSDEIESHDSRAERRRDPDGVQIDAWKQTLEELQALADERREDGWSVIAIAAAHTDTVSRDMGDSDRFGLIHVIPDNYAEELADTFDEDAFTDYVVYGANIQNYMYAVTEFLDLDRERSILIANRYDMARATGMVASAEAEGALYTHFKTIDGTELGTFKHEDYASLVANPNE